MSSSTELASTLGTGADRAGADRAGVEQVRQAWAEVLAAEPDSIGLDTNFFELGGNSLLLVMLWEELTEATGRELKVADLFQHSTVRAQARLLGGDAAGTPEAEATPDRGRLLGRAGRAAGEE